MTFTMPQQQKFPAAAYLLLGIAVLTPVVIRHGMQGAEPIYNAARDYNPTIGRYIEADPLGMAAGQNNLYAYVDGNPVMHIDPRGLSDLTLYSPMISYNAWQNDRTMSSPPNMFTVGGHGNSLSMLDEYSGSLSPEQLASMIRDLTSTNGDHVYQEGTPIWLRSCNTGSTPSADEGLGAGLPSFAQRLANIMQVPVWAANNLSWAYPDTELIRITVAPESQSDPNQPDLQHSSPLIWFYPQKK